jgi:hypothetical protein
MLSRLPVELPVELSLRLRLHPRACPFGGNQHWTFLGSLFWKSYMRTRRRGTPRDRYDLAAIPILAATVMRSCFDSSMLLDTARCCE